MRPRARLAALKRAYIPAAALLAAWLFATLALDSIEWVRLSAGGERGRGGNARAPSEELSGNRAILDPAEQMRRGLEDLGAAAASPRPGTLLFLLARAAPAIERRIARARAGNRNIPGGR